MKRTRTVAAIVGALAAAWSIGLAAVPTAMAAPDTPVLYPAGSSATVATGRAFDICAAPSLAALRAWRGTSPYGTVNIYFGGINRACAQPNLTAVWVREATAMGWRLLPTYLGSQPSCILGTKPHRFNADTAAAHGTANARDAVAKAKALGLLPGSTLYADVEHYNRSYTSCVTAVRRYVSAWTATLHANGYLAGVYVHQDSGLRDLAATYKSASYNRPDAVWMARWDRNSSLWNWPTASNLLWANQQRIKQYKGDHPEVWGGVRMTIDTNAINAPVATVARAYRVTNGTPLNARSGPSTTYPVVRAHAPGSSVSVICQGLGRTTGTTAVWDRLSDGTWVSDYYVSTPSRTGFTAALPKCTYPGQVTSATPLNARTGPGASFPVTGPALQPGALAYVMCQKDGSAVGTSRIWNRLSDGRWVSDYYVSNRSNTTVSAPVPRCP